MPEESLTVAREGKPGSVRVTVAGTERRALPRAVRLTVVALTAVLTSAGVVVGIRALHGPAGAQPSAQAPAQAPLSTLDARSITAAPAAPAAPGAPGGGGVPGSSRLALLGPRVVLDTRDGSRLRPGALAPLALPALPAGSTAVLLEVSLLAATGPGAVTIRSGPDEIPVLRLPRAGTMTTASVVVPAGADRGPQVRTEGGGHLLVQLLGAFEPARDATAGRLVAVPATRVLDLVPATDGKDATIDLTAVPALREPGRVGAVVLNVTADVGRNGGLVTVDGIPGGADQRVLWMPTTGTDRTRTGFLVVPVSGTTVDLHYQAGTQLQADLIGYVTGQAAPREAAGLLVPVPLQAQIPAAPVPLGPGKPEDLTVVPPDGLAGVPAGRVAAALVGVAVTGDRPGGVAVYAPGSAGPNPPTVTAAPGVPRSALTLVATVDGAVRTKAQAGAAVSLTPQALVLAG
jgi:hypothetical protein